MKRASAILLLCLITPALWNCTETPSQALRLSPSSPEIVGGISASAGDPGLASTVSLRGLNGKIFCSGTLIATDLILTAAHCVISVTPANFVVGFAAAPEKLQAVDMLKIEDGFISADGLQTSHGSVVSAQSRNDLALLHLKNPAPEGAEIALLSEQRTPPGSRVTVRVFGYGKTSGFDNTELSLHQVELTGTVTQAAPDKILFDQTAGQGICHGDSGGPSYRISEKNHVVVGISSSLTEFAEDKGKPVGDICRYKSYVTQVGVHIAWIKKAAWFMQKNARWNLAHLADNKNKNCFSRPDFRDDFESDFLFKTELGRPYKLISHGLGDGGKSRRYKISGQDLFGKPLSETLKLSTDGLCRIGFDFGFPNDTQ